MRLTVRDQQVILNVYRCRVLTSHQIEVLHFPSGHPETRSRRSACQRRLQKLFHHGYLDRILRPVILGEGRSAYAYALGSRGADVVAALLDVDRAGVGWKPKENRLGPLFLDHLLQISEVRVVAQLLEQQEVWQRVSWIDEIMLKSPVYQDKVPSYMAGGRTVQVYPDGYFTVTLPDEARPAHFFLEVDQGTMESGRWAGKVRGYVTFRNSGASEMHFGSANFRVLAIVPSKRRLSNLKRATENAGGGLHFWFTTRDQIDIWQPAHFLEPVWRLAGKEGQRQLFGR